MDNGIWHTLTIPRTGNFERMVLYGFSGSVAMPVRCPHGAHAEFACKTWVFMSQTEKAVFVSFFVSTHDNQAF
jgi:hypothetical protein